MMRWWRVVPAVLMSLPLVAASPAAADRPTLTVDVVEDGLKIPWDVAFLPDGSMLYTQRTLKTLTRREPDGTKHTLLDRPGHMWASGETGLMSVEVSSDFATSRDIITCHGWKKGGKPEVRVVRWHLDPTLTRATYDRTLVAHLPSSGGRHGGCALATGLRHQLYIGTGDAAVGRNPQSLTSGGGKVLRVDERTGRPISTNPFIHSASSTKRRIFTYGHRNVQGLARRSDGTMWSVEHGSYRDDEVNRLVKKGNYGWNPVRRRAGDPSYNEGADSPMTDHSLPGRQRSARWRSGNPTVATSGAAFVRGAAWGDWRGALAVPELKGEELRLLLLSGSGAVRSQWRPLVLDGRYGRLRAATAGPGGALYVTTSNGTDDKILKITPRP